MLLHLKKKNVSLKMQEGFDWIWSWKLFTVNDDFSKSFSCCTSHSMNYLKRPCVNFCSVNPVNQMYSLVRSLVTYSCILETAIFTKATKGGAYGKQTHSYTKKNQGGFKISQNLITNSNLIQSSTACLQ